MLHSLNLLLGYTLIALACIYSLHSHAGDISDKKTLRVTLGHAPETLNPFLSKNKIAINITDQLFEPLFYLLNDDDQLRSNVFKSWHLSPDKMHYTLTLNDSLLWSDGSKITIEDVKASMHYLLSKNPSHEVHEVYEIFRKKAATSHKKNATPERPGVQIVNEKTIKFNLAKPDHDDFFLPGLAASSVTLVKKSQLDKYGDKAFDLGNILTLSPYKISRYFKTITDGLVLEKMKGYPDNANYYWDRIEISFISELNLRLNALKAKECDLVRVYDIYDRLGNTKHLPGNFLANNYPNTRYFILNPSNKKLKDPRIRKALHLLTDPKIFTKQNSKVELPLYGIVPKHFNEHYTYIPPPFEQMTRQQRFQEAKKLLLKAGISPKHPLHLTFNILNNRTNIQKAERFSAMVKRYGILLKPSPAETNQHYAKFIAGQYEISTLEWFPDTNNTKVLFIIFDQYSAFAKHGYHNKKVFEDLEKVVSIHHNKANAKYMHEAEKQLLNDHYILPLSSFYYGYLAGSRLASNQKAHLHFWQFKPTNRP